MAFSHIIRPRLSELVRGSDEDLHRNVAILTGARSLVRRGWLQGAWYVLEAADGRRRFVGAGSLTSRRYGEVVQACLVGAVAEAAVRHSDERGIAGPALDALWGTLREDEGRQLECAEGTPSAVRRFAVRELARWNDRPNRTQSEVVALIDKTVARLETRIAGEPALVPDTDTEARAEGPAEALLEALVEV